jgi:hypothetical protein
MSLALRQDAGKLDFMDIDWDCIVVGGGAAVVQSLLADDVGLPVPPWPTQKEDANAHA